MDPLVGDIQPIKLRIGIVSIEAVHLSTPCMIFRATNGVLDRSSIVNTIRKRFTIVAGLVIFALVLGGLAASGDERLRLNGS